MYIFIYIKLYYVISIFNVFEILYLYYLGTYLRDNAILLMDAAIQAVGILGRTYSLPLPAEGDNELNKKAIVETLFSVLSNAKLNTKVCF